jgi:AraC-like DNA-binding protein
MKKIPSIDVAGVRRCFDNLLEHGVSQKDLETALGFSREALDDDYLRIPLQNNLRMLRKGIELTEPAMAVKLGQTSSPESSGILGQIMKNCENLAELTYHFIRFQNLNHGISNFRIKAEGNYGMLIHFVEYPISDYDKRLLTELNLAACLTNVRKLLDTELVPQEMRFSYGQPEYVAAYEQHFRSPLKFNQKEDAIVLDMKQAEKPIPGSHPYMKNILMEYAEGLLAKLATGEQFQDDVKRIIADLLPTGFVDIERVSEKLNMSRWTLTRKLRKEGTTFKNLLRVLRKEIAMNYLEHKKLSTTEIAFLLGYSEASAFQRAFKRWTGKNPYDYRGKMM